MNEDINHEQYGYALEIPLAPAIIHVYPKDLEDAGCRTIEEYITQVRSDPNRLIDDLQCYIDNIGGIGNMIDMDNIGSAD